MKSYALYIVYVFVSLHCNALDCSVCVCVAMHWWVGVCCNALTLKH